MLKKEPIRTCVGCRQKKPKTKLVRIVKEHKEVIIDDTGKKSGRGAYICLNEKCIEQALRSDSLSRALKCTFDEKTLAAELLKKAGHKNDQTSQGNG
ncbi:hypothetical protein LCGC14_0649100 [marine sediment metagenome]|uniref:YlxR domain-containing protein n=1 Tax=marine sediment metagenome TaxID=412755 RepID=A0A0F9U5B4_9ZZZZ|nr:YlxR family protein [Actinomycetota bacterium]